VARADVLKLLEKIKLDGRKIFDGSIPAFQAILPPVSKNGISSQTGFIITESGMCVTYKYRILSAELKNFVKKTDKWV
jgi:hypothetical protein